MFIYRLKDAFAFGMTPRRRILEQLQVKNSVIQGVREQWGEDRLMDATKVPLTVQS